MSRQSLQVLLIEDEDHLGRKGDVVKVKPGYFHNYLSPKSKGMIADKNALRRQKRLQEQRQKKAKEDREEAEKLAAKLEGVVLDMTVKTDEDGHLYGSVSSNDIVEALQKQQLSIEKKWLDLSHPIKATGLHNVKLKLPESVQAQVKVQIVAEGSNE